MAGQACGGAALECMPKPGTCAASKLIPLLKQCSCVFAPQQERLEELEAAAGQAGGGGAAAEAGAEAERLRARLAEAEGAATASLARAAEVDARCAPRQCWACAAISVSMHLRSCQGVGGVECLMVPC